jgi:hypothetical protein
VSVHAVVLLFFGKPVLGTLTVFRAVLVACMYVIAMRLVGVSSEPSGGLHEIARVT